VASKKKKLKSHYNGADKLAKPEPEARVVRPKGSGRIPRVVKLENNGLPDVVNDSNEALRREAGLRFVFDTGQNSVRWWWENHYNKFDENTVQRWARLDKWLERRRTFWMNVDEELAKEFSKRLVKAQITELKDLESAAGLISRHINDPTGGTVKITVESDGKKTQVEVPAIPLTFSKRSDAFRVLIALDQRIDEKRETIMKRLPAATQAAEKSSVELDQEEARAMAHARLRVQAARNTGTPEAPLEADEVTEGKKGG
jgi:hypothetical protein